MNGTIVIKIKICLNCICGSYIIASMKAIFQIQSFISTSTGLKIAWQDFHQKILGYGIFKNQQIPFCRFEGTVLYPSTLWQKPCLWCKECGQERALFEQSA
jgi:hypothetical protein